MQKEQADLEAQIAATIAKEEALLAEEEERPKPPKNVDLLDFSYHNEQEEKENEFEQKVKSEEKEKKDLTRPITAKPKKNR